MKTILQGFHSFGIVLLAASIFYLGYALLQTADRVELIVAKTEGVAESLAPVVELAPEFLEESKQARILVEEVVAEVAAVRLLVPELLAESAAIRESLPPVLEQVGLMRKESEMIRAEAARVRVLIPEVLAELEAYRALVPQVLDESRRIRETIPPTLSRVERIVLEADDIASKAGENVFTGVISGIFKAPVKLLGNVTDFLLPSNAKLSASDEAKLKEQMQIFLNIAQIGDIQTFVTEDPTISLQFELLSSVVIDSMDCRLVALRSRKSNELFKQTELQICLDEDDNWFLHSSEDR
ncbi:hypothetical protein LPB19_00435 [Marinobacter salinisoli]|uniref:Uncharacterized protein n=1 Tax=Marinobacter salinisoli TaxID=2769486 RepID=A0ABX7MRM0_9GAMM|nr:hypothetical protein [Marinobacter salinisoli]QSP94929.1 hypothetical protein LPB19_00435 [Marinobacter salinisoli]